jgi:zinc D-Ala-D-Ala carboxypeptidase
MNLTKNFSLHELTKSETALRRGIPNTPVQKEIESLTRLAQCVLQPIRDHFGRAVKVNSGYRSPQVNAVIGGSLTSDHCKGMAADIEIPGVANHTLAVWIRDNLKFTQLILELYTHGVHDSGWVHVSYDPDNLKQQTMTATSQGGKTAYRNGLVA